MEKIKELLSERYLETGEYINLAFDFTKKFIKEEKNLLFCYILTNIAVRILTLNYTNSTNEVSFPMLIMSFAATILGFYLITRTIAVIERKQVLTLQRVIGRTFKYVFFIGLMFLPGYIIAVIAIARALYAGISIIGFLFWILVPAIYIVVIFLKILYTSQIYFSRDVKIKEMFKYNKHLSQGNKLRILKPILLIALVVGILSIVLNPILQITGLSQNVVFLIFSTSVFGVISVYGTALSSIIYLNVEYMDMKKSETVNIEKNIEIAEIEN